MMNPHNGILREGNNTNNKTQSHKERSLAMIFYTLPTKLTSLKLLISLAPTDSGMKAIKLALEISFLKHLDSKNLKMVFIMSFPTTPNTARRKL